MNHIVQIIEPVTLFTIVPVDRSVQLQHFLTACHLMQSVNVLRDHCLHMAFSFQLRQPDVVLYEEALNQQTIEKALYYISQAEVLIIGGTSLVVYPAAGMIDYFRGKHLVVINKAPTPRDENADILIQDSIGKVFSQI